VEQRWNDIDRENQNTWRKSYHIASLFSTNPTWTDVAQIWASAVVFRGLPPGLLGMARFMSCYCPERENLQTWVLMTKIILNIFHHNLQ
jgi:hypothetical protein